MYLPRILPTGWKTYTKREREREKGRYLTTYITYIILSIFVVLRSTYGVSYSPSLYSVYGACCTASVRSEEDSWAGRLSVIIMSTNSIQQQQQHHWEQHGRGRLVEFLTNKQSSLPVNSQLQPLTNSAQLPFRPSNKREGGRTRWEWWWGDLPDPKCQLRKCCNVAGSCHGRTRLSLSDRHVTLDNGWCPLLRSHQISTKCQSIPTQVTNTEFLTNYCSFIKDKKK